MSDEQLIAPGTLNAWEEIARRDDWHMRFVGSEIRMLIGDLRRARHRLASSPAARESEGDWVLVPREPTEAMIAASGNDILDRQARYAWSAMLAAAPFPHPADEARARLVADLDRHAGTIYKDMAQSDLWSTLVAARNALAFAGSSAPVAAAPACAMGGEVVALANRLWNEFYDRKVDPKNTLRELIAGIRALAVEAQPASPAIPAGMKPWHGGDSAPGDWDGGPVFFRSGMLGVATLEAWQGGENDPTSGLIAYTPKPASPAETQGAVPPLRDPSEFQAAIELWFTRDLSETQRRQFVDWCGFPGVEANSLGLQMRVFRHALAALPASAAGEERA